MAITVFLDRSLSAAAAAFLLLLVMAGGSLASPDRSDDDPRSAGPSPCAKADKRFESADTSSERIRAALAVARCVLAVESAPALSSLIYESHFDGRKLAKIVSRARSRIKIASGELDRLPADFDEDTRATFEDRIDMLRAFADTFAALAVADGSSKANQKLTEASVGLAIYADDPEPGIVESAKLWQGVAYRAAGRPDRALRLLRPALGSLSSNRADLMARMERCRALADRGQFIAAISLAMKLERQAAEVLAEDKDLLKSATETFRWIRVRIMRRWAAELRERGKIAEAKDVEQTAGDVLGDLHESHSVDRRLNLTEAIGGNPEPAPENTPDSPEGGKDAG